MYSQEQCEGIICCHREFGLALATQQSQRNSELEKQNNELRARVSALTKKLNRNKLQQKLMWKKLVSLITIILTYKISLKQM